MENKNPIEDLFTDSGPFDQAEVVKILKPIVQIMRDTNQVFFLRDDIKVGDKILAFALAKKILNASGYSNGENYISAVEVSKNYPDWPKGSIDTSFKQLREDKYLIGKGKKYEIPNSKISQVLERLKSVSKVD